MASPACCLLVGESKGKPVATIMVGHDGHRGVIYYLEVNTDQQGTQLGRAMVRHGEEWLKELGVWKVNLMIRDDNASGRNFYQAIVCEEEPRIVMARRL
jgi:ribosomal protein S18 acetylase RimI-like enzyme